MNPEKVKHISECFIRPKYEVDESKRVHYLGSKDLAMLSLQYLQAGLIFIKPSSRGYSTHNLLETLKNSLSLTLVHFYPLAGQLATELDETRRESLIFVDCKRGRGAKLIHASLDMTVSDLLSQPYVPSVVYSSFDLNECVNHDGHHQPLLSVQVTELFDGVFISTSMNHSVVDGTSFWQFWKIWSELHGSNELDSNDPALSISRPPIYERWLLEGCCPRLTLPFTQSDEFVSRYVESDYLERVFRFSAESIARLKAKARQEINDDTISSLHALTAHLWRSVVRAQSPTDHHRIFSCALAANDRHRLDPLLPEYYFGNFISLASSEATAGELLGNSLGWAASLLHRSVVNHDDKAVRESIEGWIKHPVYQPGEVFSSDSMMIRHSPRFDMYGNEFGLGRAVAVRSGGTYKFSGIVDAYPGCEGGGSVDFLVCLCPDTMARLQSDEEFMSAVK